MYQRKRYGVKPLGAMPHMTWLIDDIQEQKKPNRNNDKSSRLANTQHVAITDSQVEKHISIGQAMLP